MLLQFIPARGRKQPCGLPFLLGCALQFIPARGRKRILGSLFAAVITLQFIPARGRKLNSTVFNYTYEITIYPRKGTETGLQCFALYSPILQFIPARGRKLIEVRNSRSTSDYNLSPQGDGNRKAGTTASPPARLQFIPARGRKPAS